jgi:hypothetical protein
MKLIIDIEDAVYHRVMELRYTNTLDRDEVVKAVKNGTTVEMAEDCVSREAVITKIDEDKLSFMGCFCSHDAAMGFRETIKELPSVTPQPKRGHWISHREHCENLGVMASGLGAYEWCSNCDCGIDVKEFHRNYYNFCPNCGAKMEVDK